MENRQQEFVTHITPREEDFLSGIPMLFEKRIW